MAVSDEDWERIREEHQHRCFYCGRQFYLLTKDHKHSRARGGADLPENIVPACHRCNTRKNVRTVEEYWPSIDHAAREEALAAPARSLRELQEAWYQKQRRASIGARRFGRFTIETSVLDRWGHRMSPVAFMVYAALCQLVQQGRNWTEVRRLIALAPERIEEALCFLEDMGFIAETEDGAIDLYDAPAPEGADDDG